MASKPGGNAGAGVLPPQERVEQRPDGLVRITLKKAYRDGTVAVDMDPLSLLCRLATRTGGSGAEQLRSRTRRC